MKNRALPTTGGAVADGGDPGRKIRHSARPDCQARGPAVADLAGGDHQQKFYQARAAMLSPQKSPARSRALRSSPANRARAKLVKANGSGFMAAILPSGMRAISTEISPETGAGESSCRMTASMIPCRRAKNRTAGARAGHRGNHPRQYSRSRDRSDPERKRGNPDARRQDRDAGIETGAGGDARPCAAKRHPVARIAQSYRRHWLIAIPTSRSCSETTAST